MLVTSRGVATGHDSEQAGNVCTDRIFIGTLVGQLIALDAVTGQPCENFGQSGRVNLHEGIRYAYGDTYAVTSAPTVVGDVVIVGSSIPDNAAVDVASGPVRGFDARTGRLIWKWEPIPWSEAQPVRTGAANAWSTICADPALGLIFVPTGSASTDYYGGMR